MLDPIFFLFGKRIAKRLAANHYRPRSFKDMSFAFTGPDGHSYYAWQNFGEMPPARVKNIEAIMLMIDRRMSDTDLATIADDIIKEVQSKVISGKTPQEKSEGAAKITVMAQELKYRAKDILPEDLYYDLASYCVVRDDETPGELDRTVHMEKYHMLQEAGRKGADFFLHMPLFGDLLGALLTTEAGLLTLLPKWRQQRERRAMIREVLSSKTASASTTASSIGSRSASRVAPSRVTSV